MELKTGQILNFKWFDGWLGRAILFYNRIVYRTDGFSHTGIITDVNEKDVEIAEAIGTGFTISWYGRQWMEDNIKNKVISLGEAIKPIKDVRKYAKKYEGTPYGWMDLISILAILIFGKASIGFTGAKGLICSEAVARILYDASDKKIDFVTEFKKSYDLITPTDLSKSEQIKWRKV